MLGYSGFKTVRRLQIRSMIIQQIFETIQFHLLLTMVSSYFWAQDKAYDYAEAKYAGIIMTL